ncbi:hypothetical protein [Alteromonas sp. C1M14]|uniref:hypothetical protein n=1 Tax=Alteromonas sp. C1M14 TaxID=2841567 RepID=UPI001C0A40D0|nr:hypothetical protein [Alteromonas sp. C1M14]MBU2977277.1 hypothetical protein [Alteromonas sp. C1M14]
MPARKYIWQTPIWGAIVFVLLTCAVLAKPIVLPHQDNQVISVYFYKTCDDLELR